RPDPTTFTPGNWVLFPADGSPPVLLGSDLDRVSQVELPAHLRGTRSAEIPGVSPPAVPVVWTGSRPLPARPLGTDDPFANPVNLDGDLVAERIDGGRILLYTVDAADRDALAQAAGNLPVSGGHTTVAMPQQSIGGDQLVPSFYALVLFFDPASTNVFGLPALGDGGGVSIAGRLDIRAAWRVC